MAEVLLNSLDIDKTPAVYTKIKTEIEILREALISKGVISNADIAAVNTEK